MGTRSKKTSFDIEEPTSTPDTQVRRPIDQTLHHVLSVVLGQSTDDVLYLTVDQNYGCIEDIMMSPLKDFKDLTLLLPNTSTPVKMTEQRKCNGHPLLLQLLKQFAVKE